MFSFDIPSLTVVAPLAGAGIEITAAVSLLSALIVAPLAGAGIEIWTVGRFDSGHRSPLSQGRELK